MSEIITLACVTTPKLNNIKRLLLKVLPFVNKAVIICGKEDPEVEEYLKSFGDKVESYYHEWLDSFAVQYNHYLEHIKDGWVLILDDDELPSDYLLKSLKPIVERSENGNRFCCVEFRAHPIEVNDDDGGKIVNDNGPVDYYRAIFFRFEPGMKYMVDLHQSLVGYKNGRSIRRMETYYHIKSDRDSYRNSSRNWWVAGVWLPNATEGFKPPEWHEFKDLVISVYPEVKVFDDFDKIMVKGNIDKKIKDYLYKIKDIPDEQPNRLLNELRGYWKYYFLKLHPEEKRPE
jgi:hypothetical protein